jgi:hypothetical protein
MLKALQEKNMLERRLKEQKAASGTRRRTASSLTSGPNILVVGSPSRSSRHCTFDTSSDAGSSLSNASTPEKDASTPCKSAPSSRGLCSAHGSHWEEQWASRGLERKQIKSAQKDDRRFIDDNRFGCHFTSTGMPFSVITSPRISKVRDHQAMVQALQDSKKASVVSSRCLTTDSARKGGLEHQLMPRHAPGEVPEYIVRRKQKQRQREIEEAQERSWRALVPEGFRLVPDDERAHAEKATRELWQETMRQFLKIPHHDGAPSACGCACVGCRV